MFKIKSNLFLWCSFEKKNKYFFRDFFSQFIINKSNNYTGKKIKFAHLKIHIFACIFDNFQMAVQEWQSKIKCRGKKENFYYFTWYARRANCQINVWSTDILEFHYWENSIISQCPLLCFDFSFSVLLLFYFDSMYNCDFSIIP